MTEPSPIRDPGPYQNRDQALAQLDTAGLPREMATKLVIGEALVGAQVELTDYEREVLSFLGGRLSSEEAQVVAGWIMRAWKSGYGNDRQRAFQRKVATLAATLKDRIRAGHFLPDGFYYSVAALEVAIPSASQAHIRAALVQLESEGLLSPPDGRGRRKVLGDYQSRAEGSQP